MTFFNTILLWGAAALLIPLIIHLLNRRKVNILRWGAMHLLHEVLRQKKRRLQIARQKGLELFELALQALLRLTLRAQKRVAMTELGVQPAHAQKRAHANQNLRPDPGTGCRCRRGGGCRRCGFCAVCAQPPSSHP